MVQAAFLATLWPTRGSPPACRRFHRQRLVEAGRNVSDMDLAFTTIFQCHKSCCQEQMARFGTADSANRKTSWQYK